MNWQTFDTKKLSAWLLANFLRKKPQLSWLYAILEPLDWIRAKLLYEMQHDCRVIYMEKVLNEWFNVVGYDPNNHKETKTIHIEDGYTPEQLYIFQTEEEKPLYFGRQFFLRPSDFFSQYADIVVKIPNSYSYAEAQLHRLIKYYKLAGKKYIIEHY